MPTFLSLALQLGFAAEGCAEPEGASARTLGGARAAASADPSQWLPQLCLSEGVPAMLLPLAPTCATLRRLLARGCAPAPIAKPLGEACRFLAAAGRPERQMELALAVHSGGAEAQPFESFCAGARAVLAALCEGKSPRLAAAPPVQAALAQLQQGIDDLVGLSREVWELHAYFVFLDVKGDCALLETVAAQLCRALGCSAEGLVACAERTERWVEEALVMLAEQGGSEALEKRHAEALSQWRSAWVEPMRQSPELQRRLALRDKDGEPGEWFWARHFQQLGSVPWADFIIGFQDFFLRGRCPVDIADQLRAELDPQSSHIIRCSDWKTLAGKHDAVTSLIDSLLERVLEDVARRIYRSRPLDCGLLLGAAAFHARATPEASPAAAPPSDLPRRPPWRPLPPCAGDLLAGAGPAGPVEDDRAGLANGGALERVLEGAEPRLQISSAIPTPPDHSRGGGPPQESGHIAWDRFCAELCGERPCWWNLGRRPSARQRGLQARALATVSSSLACTRQALVLRVVAGSLAGSRPVLQMRGARGAGPAGGEAPGAEEASQLPAVVISANGTHVSGVAQFGRDAAKKTAQSPDLPMAEPIASRSHFSVVYEPAVDRYFLMDAGSKWGTFVKVTEPHSVSCGDWFHVGKAEFVVRHCGGGCPRHQRGARCGRGPLAERQPQGARAGAPDAHLEETGGAAPEAERGAPWARHSAGRPGCSAPWHPAPATALPVPPLEIDFVAGPRMGEKLVLTDRVSTLGRSDAATVQVSDAALASVSRVHCVLEYRGSRWRLRDSGSTNGTWRRLSCVLQPSVPVPLRPGTSVLAGTHEFIVEEAELTHWWLPSTACGVLDGMQQHERHAAVLG
ncbi:unnamed protein product [Prorocentrum cordatum]|uniref:FHA domain-containing protein n=1 Tax=Prorocentrum cordatum TaxID=2364126 RepID=A0ABN9X8W4_9DINO|nr:unnamed protein product [Polarella glacialis]